MENTHESHETPWRRRNYSEIGHFFLVFIQLLVATSLNVHTVYILRMYMKQSEIFSCQDVSLHLWGFEKCGTRNHSSPCWVDCFFTTVLGPESQLDMNFFGDSRWLLEAQPPAHFQQVGFFVSCLMCTSAPKWMGIVHSLSFWEIYHIALSENIHGWLNDNQNIAYRWVSTCFKKMRVL